MSLPPREKPPLLRARVVFWQASDLPFVEGRQTTDSCARYRAHTHPTLSVGVVDSGESLFRLGRRTIPVRAGNVVVIAPGMVHACNPKPNRAWSYRMFYFDAA